MTQAEIAADIRRVSPGALPKSLNDDLTFNEWDGGGVARCQLPDDIAEAVLIAAMVMGGQIICSDGWWFAVNAEFGDCMFENSAHGGSLQACHAAWRWSKGLDTKETT